MDSLLQSPGGPPLSQGLAVALPMDEEYGYLNDISGNNNIAIKICTVAPAAGASQGNGPAGYATLFTAANDNYAQITNNPFVQFGNTDWTLAYRVCLNSKPASCGIAGKTEFFTNYQGGGTDRFRFRYVAGVNNTIDYGTLSPVIGTWYDIRVWRTKSPNRVYMQVDNGAIQTSDVQGVGTPDTSPFYISKTGAGAGNSMDGLIKDMHLWKRPPLTAAEWKLYCDSKTSYPFSLNNGIKLSRPTSYQTYQRNGSNQANITIRGSYTGSPTAIEARWKGGSWSTIDAAPANGRFSGQLSNQAGGQGTLEVRFTNDLTCIINSDFVGVGDIYLLMGQSNVAGRVGTTQTFTPTGGVVGTTFNNQYKWAVLADSMNQSTGAEDNGGGSQQGSVWPGLATALVANSGFPVAFLGYGISGVSITTFQPAATHADRTTNYGQAISRALAIPGGIKGMIWYQGETDAQAGMAQATYNAYLDTIVNAIQTDLGVKTFCYKLPKLDAEAGAVVIRAAVAEAQGDNANIAGTADLSSVDITSATGGSDGLHVNVTAKAVAVNAIAAPAVIAGSW